MDLGPSDHCDWEPTEVEDPDSGQRYLMYRLPITAWPGSPRFVYQCSVCQGRFEPAEWCGACPDCTGSSKKRRKKRKKR